MKIFRGVVRVDGEFIIGPPKSDAGVRDVEIARRLSALVQPSEATGKVTG